MLFYKIKMKINAFYELNYHDQKIHRTTTHDIREHWTAVSTLLGLISSVYLNLHHWISNQRPQIAVPKLYNWGISSYRTQVTPNQIVMVIVVASSISSGGDYGIHCWWDLIRSKQLSSVPVYRA